MLRNYTAKYTKIASGCMGQLIEWPEVREVCITNLFCHSHGSGNL